MVCVTRTFRGDPAFAQRVPEENLARLLNVFINELVRQRATYAMVCIAEVALMEVAVDRCLVVQGARSSSSNSASKSSRDYPEDIRCATLLLSRATVAGA